MDDYMLTTLDNPYNPFTHFLEWFLYDVQNGYNTCGYLARVVNITDNMTEEEIERETERGMDEIVSMNPTGAYIKLRNSKENS